MKTPTLFKSLVAFKIERKAGSTPFKALMKDLEEADMFDWSSNDPGPTQWETIGLHSGVFGFGEDEFFRDIDGKGLLCFVRFSKRNLPARVVREKVDAMAEDIFTQTGRKPGRKERRDLQDEAVQGLLPKAFINHAVVPVIFTSDNQMLVFTTTPKRFETIVAFFFRFFGESFRGMDFALTHHPQPGVSASQWMTSKALALRSDDSLADEKFVATDFAVMKGEEIGVIRVKDRELGCAEVSAALKSGYRIEQIGLVHQETKLHFRMNLNLALSQIVFPDDMLSDLRENMGEDGNEVHAVTWMVITEYRKLIADLALDMKAEDEDEL